MKVRMLIAVVSATALSACGGGGSAGPNPSSGSSANSAAMVRSDALASSAVPANWSFKPEFKVVQPKATASLQAPAAGGLPLWNGSFVGTVFGNTQTYTFTMLGTDPSATNTTTTVPIEIIPVELRIGNKTFTPMKPVAGDSQSPVARTLASPIFQSNVDFNQGGTDIGTTQYEDAFQRANFWGSVQTNSNYHLLFKTTVAPKQELRPVGSSSTIINGVGLVDFTYFDDTVQSMIASMNVPAGTMPVVLVSGVYFTELGDICCIGGWHGVRGSNGAYSVATYMPSTVNLPGVSGFSQNVAALSHELGEFVDDPLTNNVVCEGGGILEVGDPLENNPNFGAYPYTSGGFTYDLQDLVMLPYFGAPPSTSVNGWSTFQGETLVPCQNGG